MKQHVTPLIIKGGVSKRLEGVSRLGKSYNEEWIQSICYANPGIIPIDEIEPSFGGIVSICEELYTESGPCDLVYLNDQGFMTIAECKLWRNPEARRKAVGQILDYAKDIAKWDYRKFELECLKARKDNSNSLFSIISSYFPDVIESEFIDKVQKNLTRGRFLLLIIGDGIRENMEELVSYVSGYAGLSFTLSLIEIPVYKDPDNGDLIIAPRILCKTKEIERTLVRIKETDRLEETPGKEPIAPKSKSLSEKDFYERLAESMGEGVAKRLEEFINDLSKEFGIIPKIGKRPSLNVKSGDDTYNFASVQDDGEVWFYGIVSKTEQAGNSQIGIDYLKQLADIVGGQFDDSAKQWSWQVKRNGKYIKIDEYLKVSDKWKKLIGDTLGKIEKLENQ